MKKEELKERYKKELAELLERKARFIRVENRLMAERGRCTVHPFCKKRFAEISNRIEWLETKLDEM